MGLSVRPTFAGKPAVLIFALLCLAVEMAVIPVLAQVRRRYTSPPAWSELSQAERDLVRKIESMATPVREKQVLYHYGSKDACARINGTGTYSGDVHARYSRLPEGEKSLAGHGVYIAGDPLSSLNYFRGGATQVILEPGTRVLDLTDPRIEEALEDAGIRRADVLNLPIDTVVRYDSTADWSVIKGATGVRFEPFSFETMARELAIHKPSSAVIRIFLRSSNGVLDPVLKEQLKSGNPADADFLKKYFKVLLESELAESVEDALVDRMPGALAVISDSQPEVRARLIERSLDRLQGLARGSPDWPGTVLKAAGWGMGPGARESQGVFLAAALERIGKQVRGDGTLSPDNRKFFQLLASMPGSSGAGSALFEPPASEGLKILISQLKPEDRRLLLSGLEDFLARDDFVPALWALVRRDRKAAESMLDALGASAQGLRNTLESAGNLDDSSTDSIARIRARYIELSGDPGLIGKARTELPSAVGVVIAPGGSCRLSLSQELSNLSRGASP